MSVNSPSFKAIISAPHSVATYKEIKVSGTVIFIFWNSFFFVGGWGSVFRKLFNFWNGHLFVTTLIDTLDCSKKDVRDIIDRLQKDHR